MRPRNGSRRRSSGMRAWSCCPPAPAKTSQLTPPARELKVVDADFLIATGPRRLCRRHLSSLPPISSCPAIPAAPGRRGDPFGDGILCERYGRFLRVQGDPGRHSHHRGGQRGAWGNGNPPRCAADRVGAHLPLKLERDPSGAPSRSGDFSIRRQVGGESRNFLSVGRSGPKARQFSCHKAAFCRGGACH